jgi:hypothetical protein
MLFAIMLKFCEVSEVSEHQSKVFKLQSFGAFLLIVRLVLQAMPETIGIISNSLRSTPAIGLALFLLVRVSKWNLFGFR